MGINNERDQDINTNNADEDIDSDHETAEDTGIDNTTDDVIKHYQSAIQFIFFTCTETKWPSFSSFSLLNQSGFCTDPDVGWYNQISHQPCCCCGHIPEVTGATKPPHI